MDSFASYLLSQFGSEFVSDLVREIIFHFSECQRFWFSPRLSLILPDQLQDGLLDLVELIVVEEIP